MKAKASAIVLLATMATVVQAADGDVKRARSRNRLDCGVD